jgi:hypothetical protein
VRSEGFRSIVKLHLCADPRVVVHAWSGDVQPRDITIQFDRPLEDASPYQVQQQQQSNLGVCLKVATGSDLPANREACQDLG